MKKENKYAVIGGQYADYYHGATPTLLGAKRLAKKSPEYWDNWQGWHTPSIYRINECEKINGEWMPKLYAEPVAEYVNKEWVY